MIVKLYKYHQCWWFDYKQRSHEIIGIDSLLDEICNIAEISKLYIKVEKIDMSRPFPAREKYLAYLTNTFGGKRRMCIGLFGDNLVGLGKLFGISLSYYGMAIEIMGFVDMPRYMMITQVR
jgi:hypothetical protein